MKQLGQFLLGLVLFGLGIFLLLDSIQISSLSFYRIGTVSTAPILLILLIIFIVVAVASKSNWTWLLVVLDIILIIVSVIFGTSFYFKHMSALNLVLMIGVFSVGIGLIIKSLFGMKDTK